MAIHIDISEFIQLAKNRDTSKFISSNLAKKLAYLEEDDKSKVPKHYCPTVNFGDMDIFVDRACRDVADDLIRHFWLGEMLIDEIGGGLANFNFESYKSIKFDYEKAKRNFREAIDYYLPVNPYDYPEIPLAYTYLAALGIPVMLVWKSTEDLAEIWGSFVQVR